MTPISFGEFEKQAKEVRYVGFCTLSGGVVTCDIETAISAVKQDMDRRAFAPNHSFQPLYIQFRYQPNGRETLLFIGCDASFEGYQEVVP